MDIATELQEEASQRAGSPEGFLQVIHLVVDGMERRELFPPLLLETKIDEVFGLDRPEWKEPKDYLPIFHQYVSLMRKVISLQRRSRHFDLHLRYNIPVDGFVHDEFANIQKQLSEATHAARRKARELPIHAFKRLKAFENRYAPLLGGSENMYHPDNEQKLGEMEWFISHWGAGRDGSHRTDTV